MDLCYPDLDDIQTRFERAFVLLFGGGQSAPQVVNTPQNPTPAPVTVTTPQAPTAQSANTGAAVAQQQPQQQAGNKSLIGS